MSSNTETKTTETGASATERSKMEASQPTRRPIHRVTSVATGVTETSPTPTLSTERLRVDNPTGQRPISTRGRMGRLANLQIAGIGSYVPPNQVTNDDLSRLGCDSDWIVRRTGILSRYHALPHQATSDLCYEASLRAIEAANISVDQIDLVLVATITPDHFTPSTACHLQRRLNIVAPAMDIGAACAGYMYAMITAGQFIDAGNTKCALVVGADLMSRTIDPEDKKTYPLFGDAAGATILRGMPNTLPSSSTTDAAPGSEVLAYQLGSEGCGGEMLCIPAGGTRMHFSPETYAEGKQYLKMDGRNVFKWAVRVFEESAKDVLAKANVEPDDLKLVVMHQANQRIIDSAVASLNLPTEKVFVNLDKYGNTSGASIPLALDEAHAEGRLERGDLVLMCGFGSGLAYGTALIRF